jgi:AAA domain
LKAIPLGAVSLQAAIARQAAREAVSRLLTNLGDASNDNEAFRLQMLDDLDTESTKTWLVGNLLGANEFSCVFGEPGSSKSVIVADLALHVAAGKPWFDRPVTQSPVVYFAGERQSLMARRLAGLKKYHALPANVPLALASGALDIRSDANARLFIDRIRRFEDAVGAPVGLVVVDTLSRILSGGDENSPVDMGKAVKNIELIRAETGAHVLVVHHVGLSLEAKGRARGSSLLNGAIDTGILVTKGTAGGSARVTKNNDGPDDEEVRYAVIGYVVGTDADGKESTVPVAVAPTGNMVGRPAVKSTAKRLSPNERAVLDALNVDRDGEFSAEGTFPAGLKTVPIDVWRGAYNASVPLLDHDARRKRFNRAVENLAASGHVQTIKDRFWTAK